MKRAMQKGISLLLTLILLLGSIPATLAVPVTNEGLGSGTPDSKPPVLNSLTLSSNTVTVPGVLDITIDATDDVSGLDRAEVWFYCEETGKELQTWLDAFYYDEQTHTEVRYPDGKLHGELEIDQYVETGTFTVRNIMLEDVAENYAYYHSNDEDFSDYVMPDEVKAVQFSVVESDTPDGEAPVLNELTLSGNLVNAPGVLEVTIDATDDVSGLDRAEVWFHCEETGKELQTWLDAFYYDEQTHTEVRYPDGKLHGELEIDQYVETGTFTVRNIMLEDIADNYAFYYDTNNTEWFGPSDYVMPEAVKAVQFSVVESDTPDGEPPVLNSVQFSRDTVTAPGVLDVTMDATDDVSGLDRAEVYFRCEETGKELYAWLYAGYYDKETNTEVKYPDGKLHGKLKISQYVETGTFTIRAIMLEDIADNYAYYDEYADIGEETPYYPIPDAVKQKTLYVINTVPDVTTSVSKPEFVEQIEQAQNGSYIVADFSGETTMPEEAFEAIAGTDKTLELTSEGITWRFNGQDIVNQTKPIELDVQITKAEETTTGSGQAIQNALEDNPGIVMKFAENGELPGEATIQVKVDYAMRQYLGTSQKLCVYYYNNQTGEMELVAQDLQVIDDTYVEFTITHCSYYVLTTALPQYYQVAFDGYHGDDFGGSFLVAPGGGMFSTFAQFKRQEACAAGEKLGDVLEFTITRDPQWEGMTFEGWLMYEEEGIEQGGPFYLQSGDLYTTDAVMQHTVPDYNVRYVAKWAEIPMSYYESLYNPYFNIPQCPHESTYYQQGIVHPTCTKDGYIEMYTFCKDCGALVERKQYPTPATGHTYENGACIDCGACEHKWIFVSPGESYCPACAVLCRHTFEDGFCTNCGSEEFDATVDGYTAGFAETNATVTAGERFSVPFTVSHSEDTYFNAGELVFRFDSDQVDCMGIQDFPVSDMKYEDGALVLEFYGRDQPIWQDRYYYLSFEAKRVGTAEVVLESAAFINKEDAVRSDLIPATLVDNVYTVQIEKAPYTVILTDFFEGPATVNEGEDYTFYAKDWENFNYIVEAQMGVELATVIDNGDGSYTIENVTGDLMIFGNRTEKSYNVTLQGSAAADLTDAAAMATYGTDYTFTIPKAEGWSYALRSITIGGNAYTDYSIANGVCTIAGTAIKGDIVITVDKTQVNVAVSVEGNGAGAAQGYVETAELGQSYTLTIVPQDGYVYTVTATMNGEPTEVIDNGDNSYTIEKVTGNIVFYVEKTVADDGIAVEQYLKINGANVWIIKFTADVEDGKVPTYDGNPMFWSDEYGAYCYLEITEVLDEEEAKSKLDITDGTAPTLGESMDVNGSGKIDASDAQLVYNMYNAMYTGFDGDVTVEKYLRADVNKDGEINVQDAAAIIAHVLA